VLTLLLIFRFAILGYLWSAASTWTSRPTSNRRSYTKSSLRVKITIIFSAIQLPLRPTLWFSRQSSFYIHVL